jgi:hypothetical protein
VDGDLRVFSRQFLDIKQIPRHPAISPKWPRTPGVEGFGEAMIDPRLDRLLPLLHALVALQEQRFGLVSR